MFGFRGRNVSQVRESVAVSSSALDPASVWEAQSTNRVGARSALPKHLQFACAGQVRHSAAYRAPLAFTDRPMSGSRRPAPMRRASVVFD